jgi:hypothetical protein
MAGHSHLRESYDLGMMTLVTVRFVIERRPGGGFSATCRESEAQFEADTLPALQELLTRFARSLMEGSGTETAPILIRRIFPSARAQA